MPQRRVPTIAIDARKLADFGIGTYLRGLLEALARLDTESRYLLLAPRDAPATSSPTCPPTSPGSKRTPPGYSLREQWSIGRHLAPATGPTSSTVRITSCRCAPRRAVVVTIHDLIHLLFPEFLPHPLALPYARLFCGGRSAAPTASSPSPRRRRPTSSSTSASPASASTSSGTASTTPFGGGSGLRSSARELAALGLSPGYFLFLGNPKPHKNLERVVRAFARLPADGRRLVIAGASAAVEPDRLRQWARELALGERLVVLGGICSRQPAGTRPGRPGAGLPFPLRGLRPAGRRGDGRGDAGRRLDDPGAGGDRRRRRRARRPAGRRRDRRRDGAPGRRSATPPRARRGRPRRAPRPSAGRRPQPRPWRSIAV